MSQIQEIELPDGTVVLARLSAPDVYGADDRDVGVLESAVAKVEQLGELITAVGSSVLSAARAVRPDEAAITFGVELAARSGKALAVLAEGEAKASVQVTLTWHLDKQPPTAPQDASEAGQDEEVPAAPAPRSPADGEPVAASGDHPGSAIR